MVTDVQDTLLALQVLFLVATGVLSYLIGILIYQIYQKITTKKSTCKHTTSQ